ncbi:MAG: DNA-directed RNA polymerase subunit omega [Saprospiraceae bacterium]|nr:DNA-directed RNA polymerase subunit omega [Saprospiraceae bacterium]
MSDIKTKVQGVDPNIQARNIGAIIKPTNNIYESLNIITRRSKQLSIDLKHELNQKLQEFTINTDTIEEVQENKEQIEISKFYERLPNPSVIALDEFLKSEIHYRYGSQPQPPVEDKKKEKEKTK